MDKITFTELELYAMLGCVKGTIDLMSDDLKRRELPEIAKEKARTYLPVLERAKSKLKTALAIIKEKPNNSESN